MVGNPQNFQIKNESNVAGKVTNILCTHSFLNDLLFISFYLFFFATKCGNELCLNLKLYMKE